MQQKKTVGVLTVLKIVAAVLSVIYSIIQVQFFGTSTEIETYFAATALLLIIFSLSQSGLLSEIFLPIYHRLKADKGSEIAIKAFSVVVNRVAIFVTLFCIASFFLAPILIELVVPGFEPQIKEEVVLMFRATFFLLLPMVLNSFFITILNAEQIYGKTELIGLFRVLLNLIILLVLFQYFGVWTLVISLIAGHVLSSLTYIYLMKKKGFQIYPILSLDSFDHSTFFKAIYSTLFYVGSTQFYNIILNSSISFLPQGYYAVFNYVTSLYTKTRGVFTQPLTTVFFTSFSIALSQKAENLKKTIKTYLSFTMFLISVILLLVISFGDAILAILWGSEKFPPNLINTAYLILVFNYIALLITSLGNIYRKIVITLEQARLAYVGWAIAQLITAGIIFFLFKELQEEALKYVFLINVILLNGVSWLIVANKEWSFANSFDWREGLKLLIIFFLVLPIGFYLGGLAWELNWVENQRISLLIATGLYSTILLFVYAVFAFVFKINEVNWALDKVKHLSKKLFT